MATADPGDQIAAKKMKFAIQLPIDWVVVEYPKLIATLTELGASANESLGKAHQADLIFDDITSVDDEAAKNDEDGGKIDSDDAPVVRFFHKMLVDAINMRASDLHFEPYEFSYRVRCIDGELREIATAPPAIKDRLYCASRFYPSLIYLKAGSARPAA